MTGSLCGAELEEWSKTYTDIIDQFLAESIKQFALFITIEHLINHVSGTYDLGKTAALNPGSLLDWPLSEQALLFPIIGNVEHLIGVKLTKTFLLVPVKSHSGIIFPNEVEYVNCKLCTKKNCPTRRAPFDSKLYKERLG